jgi:regulator of sigma E protease
MHSLIFALGIFLFICLVLVHEWGHFIVARRNGVFVEEFGLGFPPQATSKKLKSGMRLSLNWLPLGGFVKMRGEHDSDTAKGSFGAASVGAKSRIMLAGVGMNFLVGFLILTILAAVGMPKLFTQDNVGQDQFTVASDTKIIRKQVLVGAIQPGSPAAKAGLQSTDELISTSSGGQTQQFATREQIHDATSAFAGQTINLEYIRNGQISHKNVQLLSTKEVQASQNTDNPKGYLGIQPTTLQVQRSTWSAPVVAVGLTKQIVVLTFSGLGHAFAGPIAIGVALWDFGHLGLNFILFLIALISLTLALMNILPIPALDGGRLFMMWFSRGLLHRPFTPETEERIVGASFAVLIGLIFLITVVDVKRFF